MQNVAINKQKTLVMPGREMGERYYAQLDLKWTQNCRFEPMHFCRS